LFLLGALWPRIFPATAIWTEAKADRTAVIAERLEKLNFTLSQPISLHSGEDRGVLQRELIDLIREREKLHAEFDRATKRPQTASASLKVAGIVVASIGVVIWCGMRLHEIRNSPPTE
jgi:hypothetical protein